MDGMNRVA